MFVELLERLDPNDAKLIIAVKDKKLSYKGLSYKLVKDTWPDLLPDVEEKKDVEEKQEVPVEVVKKDTAPTTSSKGIDW